MSLPIFNIVPNVILAKDFNVPNTLTPFQCTMSIGINDVGYGTTGETNFYNGYTPPAGGWTIYYSDSSGNIYTQVAQNETDLIEITNYLYGEANHYSDIVNAILYYYGDINSLGGTQILANYDLPNFVTSVDSPSNLALCLLSGYSMSYDYNLYSGEFPYWIDLAQSNVIQIDGSFSISGTGAQTSFVFNGINTVGNIGYSGNNYIPVGNQDYTISIWFNPSDLGGPQGLVGWGNYGSTNQVNALRLDGSELYHYWWANDLATDGANITNGNWYNAVCSYNSFNNTRYIYINGNLITTDNPSGTHAVPNADNLTIGYTGDGSTYFNGLIQNVNIYNVCLNSNQIVQNYQALEPIIAPAPVAQDFTIEWYMNMSYAPAHPRVYSFGTYPAYNGVSIEGGVLYWWLNNGVGLSANIPGDFIGDWYHVALERYNEAITIYYNGVALATTSFSSTIPTGGNNLFIGDEGTGTTPGSDSYFPGYINNFRYTVGDAVYKTNFTPSTTPLTTIVPYTKLLILQEQDDTLSVPTSFLTDNSGNGNNATVFGDYGSGQDSPFTSGGSTYSLAFDGASVYLTVPANSAFNL